MDKNRRLRLDQQVIYQIKVPGELNETWTEWVNGLTIEVERGSESPPVTTLTGTFDQAALLGLLRRLYSLGLPLISVTCMPWSSE